MRKVVIGLIIALVATYITLSFLDGNNEYKAEKLFYRAQKIHNKIRINPDVAPPGMLASLENNLQKIIKEYPETKTAQLSHVKLAEVYMSNKEYGKAVEILDSFIAGNDQNMPLLSKAHFMKGVSYEKQDKWPRAIKEFKTLKDKYINTPFGLQAPLYIAQYYVRKRKDVEARSALNEAAILYENIQKENRETLLGYTASNLLVQAYMGLNKYEKAGEIVKDTLIDYPSTMAMMQQLSYIELIFIKTLNRPEKAIELYNYIIENTKDNRLKTLLQEKIGGL